MPHLGRASHRSMPPYPDLVLVDQPYSCQDAPAYRRHREMTLFAVGHCSSTSCRDVFHAMPMTAHGRTHPLRCVAVPRRAQRRQRRGVRDVQLVANAGRRVADGAAAAGCQGPRLRRQHHEGQAQGAASHHWLYSDVLRCSQCSADWLLASAKLPLLVQLFGKISPALQDDCHRGRTLVFVNLSLVCSARFTHGHPVALAATFLRE